MDWSDGVLNDDGREGKATNHSQSQVPRTERPGDHRQSSAFGSSGFALPETRRAEEPRNRARVMEWVGTTSGIRDK